MLAKKIFGCFIILFCFSCGIKNDDDQDENIYIYDLKDTIDFISKVNLIEKKSDFSKKNEIIWGLSSKLDTLELTYYFGLCECPQWFDFQENPNNNSYLEKQSFYIEPASNNVKLPYYFEINGTTIRFIGRQFKGVRLPKKYNFTTPAPYFGKTFRYYSYEILHPYSVWGYFIDTKKDKDSIQPIILNVK